MLWIIVTLLALILITLWLFLYQLLKQQGRILLRLDRVEEQPNDGISGIPSSIHYLAPIALSPFRLPDLDGKIVALEDFRGKRALLVHWNPQCSYCKLIAPDLAAAQGNLTQSNVALVLVSYGDAEANRQAVQEYGLKCPILLQRASSIEAFQTSGTPSAYLLDEQGRVANPLAVGSDQVLSLVHDAVTGKRRPVGQRAPVKSRIERTGLKAGTQAPAFTLPDVYGRSVSLKDYRGRRVLLVFSDPHCGPCNELASQLAHLHRAHHDDLAIIMVSRGDPEENRHKAADYGFKFPVVVQDKWKLSKEYGIFATPVAFLISEEGLIEQNVATGVDAILALANDSQVMAVRS